MDYGFISAGVGIIAFVGYLIWLIVRIISWDSKIPPIIGMLLCVVMVVCGAATMDTTESQIDSDAKSEDRVELYGNDDLLEEADGPIKSGQYTLPSGYEIRFDDSVRNDVTGNWRISSTSDSFVPAEYAVEYYETMFSSDDEIHAVWNATYGTMTCIKVFSGVIFADTHEYVKGEEHDAKLLFSGMLLDSKMFDAETGEEIHGIDTQPKDSEAKETALTEKLAKQAPAQSWDIRQAQATAEKIETPRRNGEQ